MTPKANVVDLFHGNVVRDFGALRDAGVRGVIHKCTQGAGYADPAYAARRGLAREVGLMWGAYSFNTGESVQAQVEEFLTHAQPDDETLVCLDFEDNPHSQMSLAQAEDWVSLVHSRLGRWPVLYSGNRVKDLLGSNVSHVLANCRLWLAQYGPVPHVQATWQAQWLWQFSEHGKLPGTDGALDLNFFDGSDVMLELSWSGVNSIASLNAGG